MVMRGDFEVIRAHDQIRWWARDVRGCLGKSAGPVLPLVGHLDSCMKPDNWSLNNYTGEPRGSEQLGVHRETSMQNGS